MNEKDLEIFTWDKIDGDIVFYENEAMIDYDDVVELLNEIDRLRKENEELKTYKKKCKKVCRKSDST